MLSVKNLNKSFGPQNIFKDAEFTLEPGEKAGIVGRNGQGKSTLLKIIAGREHADGGEVTMPRSFSAAYLTQDPEFSGGSVIEEAAAGLPDEYKNETWRTEKILSGLGFSENDFQRPVREFSGGFQVRINLAKLLSSGADILMLDEPTNYLDITSIRWLEQFLKRWKGELLLISHDRTFMDSIVDSVIGINRMRLIKTRGDTGKFYNKIAEEDKLAEAKRNNSEKKQKQIEEFVSKFRAKARQANMVQSRLKTLEKMETVEIASKSPELSFKFSYHDFPGKYLMEAEELSFAYGEGPLLFSDLSFSVSPKDKICIIGKNGKGKSTLLNLLTGKLKDRRGKTKFHRETKVGYFTQSNSRNLHPDNSVYAEISRVSEDKSRNHAMNICGAMLFSGDSAEKKINVLSGGERSRVLLGQVLAKPANLLLLDEPTHHLDMQAIDSLAEAINNFPGAVITVTHDERLLRRTAEKLIVFQSDRAFFFDGDYEAFLQKHGWEEEGPDKKAVKKSYGKKEERKKRAEFFREKNTKIKPVKRDILELEKKIMRLEEEMKQKTAQIEKAASDSGEGGDLASISAEMGRIQKETEDSYLLLSKKYDELTALEENYSVVE
ncbi:MAG: ABC-F family ATP-binding cassette domain-containing protein [Fibrobacterota bacterium]